MEGRAGETHKMGGQARALEAGETDNRGLSKDVVTNDPIPNQ